MLLPPAFWRSQLDWSSPVPRASAHGGAPPALPGWQVILTGAGSPPSVPRRFTDPEGVSKNDPELKLPGSLGTWVAALMVWPVVDEPTYRLVARCFDGGRGPEWTFLSSLLVHDGLVRSGAAADTYTFREEWLPTLERGVLSIGGVDAVRSKLIDAWLEDPDLCLVGQVVSWASDLARWEAVDRIWLTLGERTRDISREALAVYRDLPLEARKARPILTWASGAAESALADSPRAEGEAVLQRLLLDSALLHADWSVREDTDTAVSAGTIRMIGERRLPTTHAGQSLEAAWRTKQEIDAFIDTRSRAGNGPGRTAHAGFRAFSARLALFLGDPLRAVNEARWASLLSDWEPISVLAEGAEALANSFSRDDGPAQHSTPPLERIEDHLGVRGLTGMGQVFGLLADGYEALRRLDREGVERALSLVNPEASAVAGTWSVRASLAGFRDALWDEVGPGLPRLSEQITSQAILGREQEEPLGGALLTRARVVLLTKAGAFGAATRAAETLPGTLKVLPMARIHLWSGQFKRAIQLADGGSYAAGLELIDQHQLSVVKAAAALLEGTCGPELRAEGLKDMRRMLQRENFLPIAMLPQPAREALLELYHAETDSQDANFPLLTERLRQLNDAGETGVRPVHLTAREAVLLPLLATDESVPDIARKLHVSVNTVRKQVATLRGKFHADTRAQLVTKAIAYGAIH